jgi:outer membrane protein
MLRSLLAVLLLTCVVSTPQAQAQTKPLRIGYTNQQLLFGYLPESAQIETEIRAYEQKLSEALNVKKAYLETKVQEFQSLRDQGKLKPEEEETMRKDLVKLQEEVQKAYSDAETKLSEKSETLLKPVQAKIQSAIDAVAAEEGYTYVFNATAGNTSVLLHGPAEDDITDKVLKKMGITRPAPSTAPGGTPAAPGTAPRPATPAPATTPAPR